ncbi:MAG TPA: VOC family protein [Candidatus Sulfotelmatobacter sp.]|nr:VOC family protein [Candidatus Sulfotelmatobacter sp.]
MLIRNLRLMALVMSAALAITMVASAQDAPASGQATDSQMVPLIGIAGVTFKASNLDKSRAYYRDVLGLPEAFDVKDSSGTVTAYFKVNDDQYIEVTPTLKPGELIRESRVVFQSSDLQKLHAIYLERGVKIGDITKGPDGNPVFRVIDPEGNALDFIQYVSGSQEGRAFGKFLNDSRISGEISHVGVMMKDRTTGMPFYQKLGLDKLRSIPGGRGEYVELPSSDSNLETKDPPLDRNNPATHDQYEHEVYGAVYHVSLWVPDIRVTRDTVQKRGGYSDVRVRAAVGHNRHWLIHLFDPDGTRTEIMSVAFENDLPAGTIMGPGASGPPILPPPGSSEGRGRGRGRGAPESGPAH